jgi:hypothetical protein
MKRLTLILAVLFFVSAMSGCCKQLTRTEAANLATASLEEYCRTNGLKISQFSKPEISSETNHPWIFDYESVASAQHLVRIYIDCYGNVERHSMKD